MHTQGGGLWFFLKVCSADSAKKMLSPHMKKKLKFSKPIEVFMPVGGGGDILFGSTRERNYFFVSEMKKNSLLRKKTQSRPCVSNGLPLKHQIQCGRSTCTWSQTPVAMYKPHSHIMILFEERKTRQRINKALYGTVFFL